MIPVNASFLDAASLAAAAWLLTYLIHSTILLGVVRLVARFFKPALAMEETLWKMALVGAVATALWQTAGLGASPFGHRLDPVERSAAVPFAPAGETVFLLETPDADPILRYEAGGGATGDRAAAEPAVSPSPEAVAARPAPPASVWSAVTDEGEVVVVLSPTRKSAAGDDLRAAGGTDRESGAATTLSPGAVVWTVAEEPAPSGPGMRATVAGLVHRAGEAVAGLPWALLLVGVWGAGAACGVVRLLRARFRLRRLLRGRREIADGHLIGMLDRLRAAAGVRRTVRLSLSPRLAGPVALGRGEICLPRRVLTDLNPGQQQSVLAHELAHLERGDPGWLWISAIMEAVFFFQPLNGSARRRLRDLAEFLCDDWAVRHAGGNLILARCLAEVAGWVSASPALASGMAQKSSPLVRRIERLLEDRDLFREPGRGWRWLAGLVLVGAVAAAAPGITTGSYQRSDNAPWAPGPAPWPDYPFVLTPPGWTTTPLSASTWDSAPILEGDGQLGEVFGYPTGLPAELPADVYFGYPSSEEDERFVRVWPSPRMTWRPVAPAARSLPPSPREAVRIRIQPDCCPPPERSEVDAARAFQEARRAYEVQVADRARALREVHDAREANERRVHRARALREGHDAREANERRVHRAREAVLHAREARLHREAEALTAPAAPAPPPVTVFSGGIRIPSEKFAVFVNDLSEQLDQPLAVTLGDVAAAVEYQAEDGVVDLEFRLDRLAELAQGIDVSRLADLKRAVEDLRGEELERAAETLRDEDLQRVVEVLRGVEIRFNAEP